MATYRVLAMIPTTADVPTLGVQAAPDADVGQALRAATRFAEDMAYYSAGMCEIDTSIRVLSEIVPSSVFTDAIVADQHIIWPISLAQWTGDFAYYDVILVYNPASLSTATTFRGVGGATSLTPYAWVKVDGTEVSTMVHEFGHAMTVYLSSTTGEYTNFPTCSGQPAMHCGAEYGFTDDTDPRWYKGFFQGTLADGTGINATGWAVDPPTVRGDKQTERYRALASPWGRISAIRLG